MTDFSVLLMVAVLGYALGSLPFGFIFTRLFGRGDIRTIGSGNIGATNVLRTGSKLLALLTLLADGAKAFLAVWVGNELGGQNGMWVAAPAVLLGHLFPIWLGFKGGKGVAVYLGMMLQLSPITGVFALIIWALAALITRISSVAALVMLLLTLPLLYLLGEIVSLYVAMAMGVIIFWTHRDNIRRLREGTEPRIGQA